MTGLLDFLYSSQKGKYANSRLPHTRANLDFLIERYACNSDDCFTIPPQLCEIPPYAAKFRKDACGGNIDLLAVACEIGNVHMVNADAPPGNLLLKTFSAHKNAIFDICWLPDKAAFITVSGDQKSILWDASTCEQISTFEAHESSVKCVDVCPSHSSVFATGSKDGTINIWDTRVKSGGNTLRAPEISISEAHQHPSYPDFILQTRSNGIRMRTPSKQVLRSVTAIAFQDLNNLASGGVADGSVKIWDLRKSYASTKFPSRPKYILPYGEPSSHGCTSLTFDSSFKHLFVCCTNHKICRFDCHSYTGIPTATYWGMKASYFVKHSLSYDDQYLICGSANEKAYMWKVDSPGDPIAILSGHTAEVSAVSWHPRNITKFVTCSDDGRSFIWKLTEKAKYPDNQLIGSTSFADKKNEHEIFRNLSNSESPRNGPQLITTLCNFKQKSLFEGGQRSEHQYLRSFRKTVGPKKKVTTPKTCTYFRRRVLCPNSSSNQVNTLVNILSIPTSGQQKEENVNESSISNCSTSFKISHLDGKENIVEPSISKYDEISHEPKAKLFKPLKTELDQQFKTNGKNSRLADSKKQTTAFASQKQITNYFKPGLSPSSNV